MRFRVDGYCDEPAFINCYIISNNKFKWIIRHYWRQHSLNYSNRSRQQQRLNASRQDGEQLKMEKTMPEYRWKGKDQFGNSVKGVLIADDREQARQRLFCTRDFLSSLNSTGQFSPH